MALRKLQIFLTYFREYRESFYTSYTNRHQLSPDSSAKIPEIVQERLDWTHDILSHFPRTEWNVDVKIVNDPIGQSSWALENESFFSLQQLQTCKNYLSTERPLAERLGWQEDHRLLAEQIVETQFESASPDVVLCFNCYSPSADKRKQFRTKGAKVVIQCSYAISSNNLLCDCDLVLTVLDSFYSKFSNAGICTRKFFYGFNKNLLAEPLESKPLEDVCFVGQLGPRHSVRAAVFEEVAKHVPFRWYGPEVDVEHVGQQLRKCYRGEAFGMSMYSALASAGVGINGNADFALSDFGNIRTWEIMGLGLPLVNARCGNYPSMFSPGKLFLEFANSSEAISCSKKLLDQGSLRDSIAILGQQYVLENYTTEIAVQNFFGILNELFESNTETTK